jgi:outer membrane protein OmpA-like peptidoglycan-associated protein
MRVNLQLLTLLTTVVWINACAGQNNSDSAELPSIEAPTFNAPTLNTPSPDAPQPSAANEPLGFEPKFNAPSLNPVEADFPEIDFPKADFPVVDFPEVDFPEIQIQQGKDATVYTLPADILFDFDKANIRPDAEIALRQISTSIAQRFANAPLQINGHTDAKGSDAYNVELSDRRAASVKQWLETNAGLAPDRMNTKGYGETRPVAPNTHADGSDNPAGRQQNRRVEIVVQTP